MRTPPEHFTPLREATATATATARFAGEPQLPTPATTRFAGEPQPQQTTPTPEDRGLLARLQARNPHAGTTPLAHITPTHVLDTTIPRATAQNSKGAHRRGAPRHTTLKKLLVTTIVMATIGTLASGTLATFTAQTNNTSNTFSTGTLVLGNTPTAYAQLSTTVASGTSLASIPINRLAAPIPGGVTVTISNNAATPTTQTLTVAAAGALPGATTIPINAAPTASTNYAATTATVAYPVYYEMTTTTAAIAAGSFSSITVNAIPNSIPSGTTLTLSNTSTTQTVTTNASAQAGATTLSITTATASTTYASGSMVFWSAMPVGITTTTSITGSVSAIPVNTLQQAVPANSTILLNNPSLASPNFISLTVSAAGAAVGATSIPLSALTALNNTYPAGSLVSYSFSSGQVCYSTTVTSGSYNNGNSNTGCGSLDFTAFGRPQATSEAAYTADLTIQNYGSLPASTLTVYLNTCGTANNPAETFNGTGDLCTKLEVFLQEWSDAAHTTPKQCWYGQGSGSTTCTNPPTDGTAPVLNTFNGSSSPLTLTGGLSGKGSAGDKRYFTIGLRLPYTADNTFQGRTSTFDFVWTLQQ